MTPLPLLAFALAAAVSTAAGGAPGQLHVLGGHVESDTLAPTVNLFRKGRALEQDLDASWGGRSWNKRAADRQCADTTGAIEHDRSGRPLPCTDIKQFCSSDASLRELCPATCDICLPGWNSSVAERRALEALYESAGGPGWVFGNNRPNNWGEGECHCQWIGVTCMNSSACSASPVVKIAFPSDGVNASGTLPGSVFAGLTQLQFLGMVNNPGLSGTLPEAWAKMTEMRVLGLYSNHVSGTLPEAWANMTDVKQLALYSNHLSGSLPEA